MIDWLIYQPDYIALPVIFCSGLTLALMIEKSLYLLGI